MKRLRSLSRKKKRKTRLNAFQPVRKTWIPWNCLPAAKTYPFQCFQCGERETKSGPQRKKWKKKKGGRRTTVDRLTCPQVCAHAENRYAKGNWKRHAGAPLWSFFFFTKERRRDTLLPRLSTPFYFFGSQREAFLHAAWTRRRRVGVY